MFGEKVFLVRSTKEYISFANVCYVFSFHNKRIIYTFLYQLKWVVFVFVIVFFVKIIWVVKKFLRIQDSLCFTYMKAYGKQLKISNGIKSCFDNSRTIHLFEMCLNIVWCLPLPKIAFNCLKPALNYFETVWWLSDNWPTTKGW